MGDAPPAKKYTYDAATFVSGHFFAEYVHTTFCVEKDGASTWRKTEFPLETLCTSTAKEGDSAETGAPKAPLKEPLQKMLATKITDEEIRQGLEEFANKYGIAMQKVTELKEALDEVLDKKWKGKQNAANEPRPVYVLVHIATKPGDPTSPAHYTNFVEAFKQNKKTSEERREADGVQQYWRCFFKSTSTAADKEGSRNFVDVDQMFVTEAFQSEGADLFHRTPGLDGSFKKIWLPVRTAALAEENPQNDWPTQIYGAVQAVKDRSHIRHWMSLGTESGTASLDVNLPKGRKSGGHFTLWDDLRTRWYDCTSNLMNHNHIKHQHKDRLTTTKINIVKTPKHHDQGRNRKTKIITKVDI
ncbi:unnamed protein product [Amoebophrya sp. A25]|nr:unnamed protein product [Amoebophrya sp. A25]|eukprot:GSA25T00010829001.1